MKPAELALAKQLIEQTSNDDVRAGEVQGHGARARARDDPAEGRRPGDHRRGAGGAAAAKIIDLMEALKASLAAGGRPRRRGDKPTRQRAQGVVKLLAGTSGFAFKEWKGSFYPDDLKDDGCSASTPGKFPTVEINNTFYRLPQGARAARVGVAGAGCVHVRDQGEPADHAPRAAQAGVRERSRVSAQEHRGAGQPARPDPVSAAAEPEEGCRAAARLPRARCRPDRQYTIEFRHESWFDDDVLRRCCASATSRCA